MKKVAISGYFDPIHVGHLEYLRLSKKLGDKLVVIVNNNHQCILKKGKPFMDEMDRLEIVKSLEMVDEVFLSIDTDKSVCASLEAIKPDIFANGGDRGKDNIPEMSVNNDRVSFAFSVGGDDKKNSSSWILKEWSQPTTQRAWGSYTVLHKGPGWQVKELAFGNKTPLSDQRHFIRSEHWHVIEGTILMDLEFPNGDKESKRYGPGESIDIPVCTWHKAHNVGSGTAKVIEVWMGEELTEDDIERRD